MSGDRPDLWRGRRRLLLLGIGAVLLAGCTGCDDIPINTDYGSMRPDAVNGFSVLFDTWRARFDVDEPTVSGDDIDEFDALFFIERDGAGSIAELDEETIDWLDHWLLSGDRQLVLLLRDGRLGHWLLQQWIDELEQAKRLMDAEDSKQEVFDEQLRRLRERQDEEMEQPALAVDELVTTPWFDLQGIVPHQCLFTRGPLGGPMPTYFEPGRSLSDGGYGYGFTSLVHDEAGCYLAEVAVGSSHILVISDSVCFLNAGLVDRRARRLAEAVGDRLAARGIDQAAWVRRLRHLPKIPPPNTMGILFTQFPWNVAFFHFIAILLIYLWYRAAWLGRITPPKQHHLEHFGQHLTALGGKLRLHDGAQTALSALARWHRRKAPAAAIDEEGLVRQARRLYEEPDRRQEPAPAPTDPAARPAKDT